MRLIGACSRVVNKPELQREAAYGRRDHHRDQGAARNDCQHDMQRENQSFEAW